MTLVEELMAIAKLNHTTNKIIQLELNKLNQLLCRHEIERLLALPDYQHPQRLERFGFKVYSQNDEDGIIDEIFKRIGTTNKYFVEFGVENGLENNSHFLLFQGWKGLWIEGNSENCDNIRLTFDSAFKSGHLALKNAFITKDNINDLIGNEITGEIDFLSIDIDGNDYHVFEAINVIHPRVVVIEYNAKFPPHIIWFMKYDPNYMWDGSDKQGASLKALELLGEKKGYQLVGTNLTGSNAFFVRKDLASGLFYEPAISEHLFNTMKQDLFPGGGHPARHFLG